MPRQETFLTAKNGDETIEVLKTYDQAFAREAFRNMDDDALAHLAASLNLESTFELSGIPNPTEDGYEDFIWDVMVDEAREEWNLFSYSIVAKSVGHRKEDLFVSGDWPTGKAYVKKLGVSPKTANQSPLRFPND
jgi:hypothetical protein